MDPTLKRASGIVIAVLPVVACLAVYSALANRPERQSMVLPRALAAQEVTSTVPGLAAPTRTAAPELPLVEVRVTGVPLGRTEAASPPAVTTTARTPAPQLPVPAPDTLASALSPMERGRDLTALLYADRLKELWGVFQPSVRQEWNGLSDFQAYRRGGINAYGRETGVLSESVRKAGSVSYYTRTSTFERGPAAGWTVIFGLDPAGQVVDFGIVAADALPTASAVSGP